MTIFNRNERGQGLVEYALILVLVAIVVISILTVLGPRVGNIFSRVVAALEGNAGGGSSNNLPVADAGGPYTPSVGETILIDGTGSSGDGLTYFWTNDVIAPAAFSTSPSFNVNFTIGNCDPPVNGVLGITLTVTDIHGNQSTDSTTATVQGCP